MKGKKALAWLIMAVMLLTVFPSPVFSERNRRSPRATPPPVETDGSGETAPDDADFEEPGFSPHDETNPEGTEAEETRGGKTFPAAQDENENAEEGARDASSGGEPVNEGTEPSAETSEQTMQDRNADPVVTNTVSVSGDGEPALDDADMQIIYDFVSYSMPDEPMSDEEYDFLITEYLNKVITDSKKAAILYPILFKALKINGEKLSGVAGSLYNELKPEVKKTAAGEVPDTTFSFTPAQLGLPNAFTYEELGLPAEPTVAQIQAALRAKLTSEIDLPRVLSALTTDMPYEMYWYDKTAGTQYAYGFGYGSGQVKLSGNITFDMAVASSYRPEGATSRTSMNTDKGKAVQNTVTKAKAIVDKYASLSDYAKLLAYKEEICSLVDYNKEAAQNASTPYGDPWQLVYVFDNDNGTKVVCEGYSKAFQYLCDLTEFDGDVTCYTVTGNMGDLTEQKEAHMWNIVTIDGVNYLVDVTNSDEDSVGQDGSLFMHGYDSGYENRDGAVYVFSNQSNQHTVYVYDGNDGIYSTEELTVSGTDYTSETHDVLNPGHVLYLQDRKEPSCTEPGHEAYWLCAQCKKIFSSKYAKEALDAPVVIQPVAHTLRAVSAADATCEEAGNIAYWTCEVCEKVFSDANGKNEISLSATVVPAKDHDWGDWTMTTPATCEGKGVETRTCKRDPSHTETRDVDPLGHTLNATAAVPATCEEAGSIAYWTCSTCKKIFSDASATTEITLASTVIPAKDHDWGDWEATTPATCEGKGVETRTCKRDPSHTETRDIDPLDHTLNATPAVPATCEEAGSIAYWTCSTCKKIFSDANATTEITLASTVIPAKDHDWGDWTMTTPATCEGKGVETRTCKHDPSHTETRYVDPLGHTLNATAAVPATCEEAGSIAYWTCSTCKKIFSDASATTEITLASTVIPAKDHDWGDWEATTPTTCEGKGVETRTCKRDPSHTETRDIDPLNHDWNEWEVTTPATCEGKGVETRTCKHDPSHTETRDVDPLGHTLNATVAVPATCEEAGSIAYWTCSTCKKIFSDANATTEITLASTVIPAKDHDWGDWTVTTPATCEEKGVETRTCKHDPSHTETRDIDPISHNWGDWEVTTPATYNKPGEEKRVCKNDPSHIETRAISPTSVVWGDWEVTIPATCEQAGKETRVDKNDPNHTEERDIPALNHDWNDWTVTTPATCEGKGVETRTCKRDPSHTETRDVDPLSHNWGDWEVTTPATCEGKGVETRICKRDPSHTETRDVDPLNHDWGDWEVTTPATCERKGVETRTCKRDPSHTETRDVDPLTHDWNEWEVTTPATCEGKGVETRTCKRDPSHTETRDINPIRHNWGDWSITTPATCTEKGQETRTCKNDPSHTETRDVDPLTHDWNEWEVTTPATCEGKGVETRTCKRDPSHTETRDVDPLTHNWGEWEVTIPATCEEKGEETRVCKHDSTHTESREIPAGHKLVKINAKPATIYAEGNTAYWICSICGKVFSDETGTHEITLDETVIPKLDPAEEEPVTEPTGETWDASGTEETKPATEMNLLTADAGAIDLVRLIRILSKDAKDSGIRLSIKGFEALLSFEEGVQYTVLGQQEQLFTALCILGLDRAITAQVQLSEEALTFMAAVNTRLNAPQQADGLRFLNERQILLTVTDSAGQQNAYRFHEENGRWILIPED